jgi:hypothetical protein
MKKILLLLLAVVAISVYSCTKENQADQKTSVKGTLSIKKDTVPPSASRLYKDTVPPSATLLRDTVPPSKK